MMNNSKETCEEKTKACDDSKATKHVRFYKRYTSQFIETAVSMSVSVMAAGSACLILFAGTAPHCVGAVPVSIDVFG